MISLLLFFVGYGWLWPIILGLTLAEKVLGQRAPSGTPREWVIWQCSLGVITLIALGFLFFMSVKVACICLVIYVVIALVSAATDRVKG
jgi:hypothetical protein